MEIYSCTSYPCGRNCARILIISASHQLFLARCVDAGDMSFKSNSSIICLVLALSSFDCFLSVCLSSLSIYLIIVDVFCLFVFLFLLLFLLLLFISSLCRTDSFFSLTFHLFLSHSPSPTYSLSVFHFPLKSFSKTPQHGRIFSHDDNMSETGAT